MQPTKRNRPSDQAGTAPKNQGGDSVSTLPDHAGLVAGCYVAIVQIRPRPGDDFRRYRRRVLFSLESAQRAVDRAHMEGLDASIVLCQLVTVDPRRLGGGL
ncbi:hypothetical protein GCM10023081_19980 [Arthrobacter ginkgonis]|uniref:Uncharacterized protein n=1 Tax=Arthrobacter ginkgonis TaxID=1630594 RepID=A0ABP7CBK4_9MICC